MPESAVRPSTGSAEVHVLFGGYVDTDRSPWSVASTVTYLRDGDAQVIVDPGFVPSPASILEPLRDRGVSPQDITDVIFSHHHPDHTLNAALFPNARVHDHWAIYRNDTWQMRPAEGFELSGSIRLIEVFSPGSAVRRRPEKASLQVRPMRQRRCRVPRGGTRAEES